MPWPKISASPKSDPNGLNQRFWTSPSYPAPSRLSADLPPSTAKLKISPSIEKWTFFHQRLSRPGDFSAMPASGMAEGRVFLAATHVFV
jgi:hypothetical protein